MTTFTLGATIHDGGSVTINSKPLKTGQVDSYDTHDDGDLKAGVVRSLTNNGDGTITDSNTSLMWLMEPWAMVPGFTPLLDGQPVFPIANAGVHLLAYEESSFGMLNIHVDNVSPFTGHTPCKFHIMYDVAGTPTDYDTGVTATLGSDNTFDLGIYAALALGVSVTSYMTPLTIPIISVDVVASTGSRVSVPFDWKITVDDGGLGPRGLLSYYIPRGSYAFGADYHVGDLVMAGSWYDEMISSFSSGPYTKDTKVSYYDGSNTHYWISMWDSNYDTPSQTSHWGMLPDAPSGVYCCKLAHTSPAAPSWMYGSDGVAWTSGDHCYDGMYYYICILTYTQHSGDSYPNSDSTHWTVVPGYAKTYLEADTSHWVPAPFLLNSNAPLTFRPLQLSQWIAAIDGISFVSHTDWRIPNMFELLSVTNMHTLAIDTAFPTPPFTLMSSTPLGAATFSSSTHLFTLGLLSGFGDYLDGVNGSAVLCRSI